MDEYVELHLPIVLEFPVAWKLSQAWFLQPLEGEFQVSDFTGLLCLRLFTAWVRALWPAHVVGVPLCILFRWLTFLSHSSGSFLTCLTTIRPRGLLVFVVLFSPKLQLLLLGLCCGFQGLHGYRGAEAPCPGRLFWLFVALALVWCWRPLLNSGTFRRLPGLLHCNSRYTSILSSVSSTFVLISSHSSVVVCLHPCPVWSWISSWQLLLPRRRLESAPSRSTMLFDFLPGV